MDEQRAYEHIEHRLEDENHLIAERIKKLHALEEQGINPYPYSFEKTHSSKHLHEQYASLKPEEKTEDAVKIAGRIIAIRRMGKVTFMHVQDNDAKIQAYFSEQSFPNYEQLKLLDIGDFIGILGTVFKTKTGEITIHATIMDVLAKSLRPLPEKYHGLQDVELKYRKRYLDLTMSAESKDVFRKRSLLMKSIREFLDEKGFMEVETPILHSIYGGAAAKPFTTFHNELKSTLYLRISPELYLKRLIVGGFERVYDINRNFRNESIDTTHNPEFTMLELYYAYVDYNDIMKLTEELYEYVALKVNGTTKTVFKGQEIELKAPWKRVKMLDAIKEHAQLDVDKMTAEELAAVIKKHNIKFDKEENWGNYVCALFEHFCEDKYTNPTFIIDHPKESTPLCKAHREDPRLIERFEPFCCGIELANAYSELNNPIIQRHLLEDQARQLRAGFAEANPVDEDFLQAIEYGMPPTGGLGIGLDRMAMILFGKESIRDVILFPTMKVEEEKREEKK